MAIAGYRSQMCPRFGGTYRINKLLLYPKAVFRLCHRQQNIENLRLLAEGLRGNREF